MVIVSHYRGVVWCKCESKGNMLIVFSYRIDKLSDCRRPLTTGVFCL